MTAGSSSSSSVTTASGTTEILTTNDKTLLTPPSPYSSLAVSSTTSPSDHKTTKSTNVPEIITVRCQMTTTTASSNNKTSKLVTLKGDPRPGGPSALRQLLPIALGVLSFATMLSILIVYMDTTEIRHQQFRLNMSRDYELIGVPQDDPTLVAFIREIHMKKYPMNFLKNAPIEHLNFTERHELTPEMAHFIADLVGGKQNGAFVQSMTGSTSYAMTAPWLAETLNWGGFLVEPEPRRYFSLRKQNVHRPKVQVVHACLSPNEYPKEVTIHNDEDADVRINSLLDEESSWFNSRVKCFPLYTLMLAVNRTEFDLLSLGCPGHDLQILQTLPFNKVKVEVISIHLTNSQENSELYIQSITKFLMGKSYRLIKKIEKNYIYQKINTNRTTKQLLTF